MTRRAPGLGVAAAALFSLLCPLLAPNQAAADEWTDALEAELCGRAKPAEVLAAWEAVLKSGASPHAARARWRRAQLFASHGKAAEAKAELEALRKDFPDAYTKAATDALADLPAFVADANDAGRIKSALESRKVSLNFQGTPLEEAVNFLRDISGLNFALLPDEDPTVGVTLRLVDISLTNAFKLILASDSDLESRIQGNVIVIGRDFAPVAPKKWTAQEVKANPDAAWKVLSIRVTVNFDGTPLEEVLSFLSDITGLKLSLNEAARAANPDISLSLKQVSLGDFLALVCGSHGLRWSVNEAGISVDAD